MSLYAEYFNHTDFYIQKYGAKTLVLMQVGSFFEIYGVKQSTGMVDRSIIEEACSFANLSIAEKSKCTFEGGGILFAGFRDYSLEKYLPKFTDNGLTVVVYVQDDPPTNPRIFHSIHSPGTYLSFEAETSNQMSNYAMCIWVDVIRPRIQKSGSVVGDRIRDILIYGASVVNIFTGQSAMFEHETVMYMNPTTFDELEHFVSIYTPSEVVFISPLTMSETDKILQYAGIRTATVHRIDSSDERNVEVERCTQQKYMKQLITAYYDEDAFDHYSVFSQYPVATQSYCYLLNFIQEHNPNLVRKVALPSFYNASNHLVLANHTLKQLNIIEDGNLLDEQVGRRWGAEKLTSVAGFLNRCCTPMGRRMFHSQIVNPVFDMQWLEDEYAIIGEVLDNETNMEMIPSWRIIMGDISDLEKIARQLTTRRIYPATIYKLYKSLEKILGIHIGLAESPKIVEYLGKSIFQEKDCNFGKIEECIRTVIEKINENLVVDNCQTIQSATNFETNIIRPHVSAKLDRVLHKQRANQELFDSIQMTLNNILRKQENSPNTEFVKIHETEKSGSSLQITKKRGAALKKYLDLLSAKNGTITFLGGLDGQVNVRPNEIKLVTTTNKTNDEIEFNLLNTLCRDIQGIRDEINGIIQEVFSEFLADFEKTCFDLLENIAKYIARLDILQSKAYIAKRYNYCCPQLEKSSPENNDTASFVSAKGLRHCLIEHIQQNELYVANDVSLNCRGEVDYVSGMLLYGVNAVGKTSLIRALGIAVIMAQAGMFVPCSTFRYRPFRSIYSRILGNDNLFKGLSTFAVEMSELRMILKTADENSLILGDELCSGTETESALSIFTAGLMDLHEKGSAYMFATHFHEILKFDEIHRLLEKKPARMAVYHMAVQYNRELDCLVYDRKLVEGIGPNSYGIEVCKSLYLPTEFIDKTYEIRNKYFPKTMGILSQPVASKYNSQKIRSMCEMCKEEMGEEIHHLLEQQHADKNGYIDGVHKNHPANLMAICEKCHSKIHETRDGVAGATAPAKKVVKKKTAGKGYIIDQA